MLKIFSKISFGVITIFFFTSSLGFAASRDNFKDLVEKTIIKDILNPVVLLLISLAIVFFLWGVFKFIKEEGNKKEEGKEFMFWGIVGIFVMVSVWGLVNILSNTFNLDTSGIRKDIPKIDIR